MSDNRMQPDQEAQRPFIERILDGHDGPVIATSDWISEVPSLVSRFIPRRFVPLGTNGFGRSDTREALRDHFEIDANWTAYSALHALMQDGVIGAKVVMDAKRDLGLDTAKIDPFYA